MAVLRCACLVSLFALLAVRCSRIFNSVESQSHQQQNQRKQQQQQTKQQQSNHHRRHLSWLDPRTTNLKHSLPDGLESLRMVAFGTSKTWGAGLKPEDMDKTYIRLLSPTALNLGLRATPADYPSLCLHSMIGDDAVFDVIILEFSPNKGQYPDFDRLARRLRARFPAAILLYLPIQMLFHDINYDGGSLNHYIDSIGTMASPQDPNFEQFIRDLDMDKIEYPVISNVIETYNATITALGGHLIQFPEYHGNLKEYILENIPYYGNEEQPWDYIHPNVLGHATIAHKIRQKLTQIYASVEAPIDTNIVTHPWPGGEDQCISWFANGNVTDDIVDVRFMDLQQFNPEHDPKYALEVGRLGGSFAVPCPFSHCSIYLSYMARGPHRDYPRVLVSINDNDAMEPVLIDPVLTNFHLAQIMYVGTVQEPGMATVTIIPIHNDIHSRLRFRVVGIIRTPQIY